jgi:hypothetical protein
MLKQLFHVKHFWIVLLMCPIFSEAQHFSTTTIESKPLPALPPKIKELEDVIKSSPDYKLLSEDQVDWFYWTNYSRQRPRAFWDSVVVAFLKTYPNLTSKYSASLKSDLYNAPSLPILLPNRNLFSLAGNHASDLARKKSAPSHSSTNGNSFQERMLQAKIVRCAGENISFGPKNAVLALVLLYIDEGLPDMGHRKSLLTPAYTQMGVGISNYPNNMVMVIQDFACDQAL